ncbi:patatin [Iodidimonas gelatinilytica]|uniref:Patatin n=1 Tax=Iodidimonas gelatinilytica TaxID=1236966 RepID=A0A5A7MY12_9PROT|nr:patatin-like phospholipase family protein [Iodidimonas gelatinilytica]GEQ97993.1 patatin [Iodidimonas gelatinilytica]GEQ99888.1 patatin [Iodidimonas gelatinilytica]
MTHKVCGADLPGQCVLVLQGGGALGAYQAGVYQALNKSKMEPDWVIGTSIGAINAAIIAGNEQNKRLEKLESFWRIVQRDSPSMMPSSLAHMGAMADIFLRGIPGFFRPSLSMMTGGLWPQGLDHASWYDTDALRDTLEAHVDFKQLNAGATRLTVGAVSITKGEMRYFDSRDTKLTADHIMASGALPPAFPAIEIDGDHYWDGGIYSNSPIEAVFDDAPRRNSVVFSVQLWNSEGPHPNSLWEVSARQKEIQYASRIDSHIKRQAQLHHLRHIINGLAEKIPQEERKKLEIAELAAWGCQTDMRVIRLVIPRHSYEDPLADADFTAASLQERMEAGFATANRALSDKPWERFLDPKEGVALFDYR